MRRWLILALVPVLILACGCAADDGKVADDQEATSENKTPGLYQGRSSKQWLEQFREQDLAVRTEAVEALGTIADDDAADGLIAALQSQDYDKSRVAAIYLGWMKSKAAKIIPALEAQTKDHRYQNDQMYHDTIDSASRKLKEQ
jgi:hypothetical protein